MKQNSCKKIDEEIKKHQWIESEKANKDVGFWARRDWLINHFSGFIESWKNKER